MKMKFFYSLICIDDLCAAHFKICFSFSLIRLLKKFDNDELISLDLKKSHVLFLFSSEFFEEVYTEVEDTVSYRCFFIYQLKDWNSSLIFLSNINWNLKNAKKNEIFKYSFFCLLSPIWLSFYPLLQAWYVKKTDINDTCISKIPRTIFINNFLKFF
jgi:hypothetical protein